MSFYHPCLEPTNVLNTELNAILRIDLPNELSRNKLVKSDMKTQAEFWYHYEHESFNQARVHPAHLW